MAGHRNFNELRAKMTPERRVRNEQAAREERVEMLLAELRKQANMTQAEVAAALGIKQPSLSRLENEDDMQVSTLARLVRALGGELEIAVKLPRGVRIRLTQFG